MNEAERVLFEDCTQTWGEFPQLEKFVEELGEAIVALQHYKSGRIPIDAPELLEEVADVSIMLDQFRVILRAHGHVPELALEAHRMSKVERIRCRLEQSKLRRSKENLS